METDITATTRQDEQKMRILMEDINLLEQYVHELTTFFPLPLCFVSPLGVILEVNPSFEEVFGYKFYDLIGEQLATITSAKDAESIGTDTLQKKSLRGREYQFLTKDGRRISVGVFTKIREDEKGTALGFFLGLFDLTEIKEAERQIQDQVRELAERAGELEASKKALLNMLEDIEEARRLATEERDKTVSIIQNLVDGLFVFDGERRVVLINPKAEVFFNVISADLVGKGVSELLALPQLGPLAKILEEEFDRTVMKKEVSLGSSRTIEASLIHMGNLPKRLGSILVLHDITREKEVEKMKSEFVSIAAHQLRTPISAIKWTLRMLLDGDMGQLTPQQKDFLSRTYVSNERMIELINDLLNVTRIEEGGILSRLLPLDMRSIVQTTVEMHQEEAARRKVTLLFQAPPRVIPKVVGDKEKLRFALQNLVDNAIRYTSAGGKVTVSLESDSAFVSAIVRDTGIGIPQGEQHRLFEKFFRATNAKKIDTEGSGLGLYMVQSIAKAHGGTIQCASNEREGSVFTLRLPVSRVKRVAGTKSSSYHMKKKNQ